MTEHLWPGFYYDGVTAARQPVEVSLTTDGVCIILSTGETIQWRIAEMRQTQGTLSGEQRRFEHGSDPAQSLLVDDRGFAEALRSAFPQNRSAFRNARRTGRIVLWGVAVVATAVILYAVGAGPTAAWMVKRIPPEWEARLGASAAERSAPASRRCDDSAAVAGVQVMIDRLTEAAPSPYTYRFAIVRDTTVNAFALPGGFVIVNSGLLDAAESPEEVAAVLAHEIEHVRQRHAMQALIREMPLQITISALLGNSGASSIASFAGSLEALRYRRADEASADREGARLLEAAGIHPSAMASLMRLLAQREGSPEFAPYLSSHPPTADRVAALDSLAAASHVTPRPLMDSSTWQRVRRACTQRSVP